MHSVLGVTWKGWLDTELEGPNGIRRARFENAVSDNMASAAAAALALQSSGIPYQIRIGTGAIAGTAIEDVTTSAAHNDSGPLAQFFNNGLSEAASLSYVLLGLKRVGTSAGTIAVRIYSIASGALIGTSATIAFNGLSSTAFTWQKFEFSTPLTLDAGGNYRIEILTSGYTYSAGVTELLWGIITSDPYALGYIAYWNGSAWAYVAGQAGYDAAFRAVMQTHDQITSIQGSWAARQIDGYSQSGRYIARFVSVFGVEATGVYVGNAALETSDGAVLAAATVAIDKGASDILRIYWSTEVVP